MEPAHVPTPNAMLNNHVPTKNDELHISKKHQSDSLHQQLQELFQKQQQQNPSHIDHGEENNPLGRDHVVPLVLAEAAEQRTREIQNRKKLRQGKRCVQEDAMYTTKVMNESLDLMMELGAW